MSIEKLIQTKLIHNEEYARQVIAFLKEDYFTDINDRIIFNLIGDYVGKYNKFPSKEALLVDLGNLNNISESSFKTCHDEILTLQDDSSTDLEWILDQTEKFCQEKAVYNAIMASIEILDGKNNLGKGTIPKILSDALAVSFDTHIGHDYIEQYKERYEFYHKKENHIPFNLEYFNKITNGGFVKKTLNVIMGGVHAGKTLTMTHMASANLTSGQNVLYITCEMSEEEISKRIDANLLDFKIDELMLIPKDVYSSRMEKYRSKTNGKLIVKEYPTASVGSAHFRHLLNELKLKKGFVPDIIYIDYINICISSRLKMGSNINTYSYVKAISEEFRGLAIEFEVPIVTATQTNREGFVSSDFGMENVAESFGLNATADFILGIIATEDLISLHQLMCKQLKNRYTDMNKNSRFVIGIDREKMRLYDVEQSAQKDLIGSKEDNDKPLMDKTQFGYQDRERSLSSKKKLFEEFR